MRIITLTLIALLMIFGVEVVAQAPSAPEPSAAELRKVMAELKAELEATKAETKALIADRVKEKNAQLEASLAATKKKAEAQERKRMYLASLIVERGEVQIKIKELQLSSDADRVTLEALLKRNTELENQIKKANRSFACRFLHLGCIR